jgi:hypothetical protein
MSSKKLNRKNPLSRADLITIRKGIAAEYYKRKHSGEKSDSIIWDMSHREPERSRRSIIYDISLYRKGG